LQLAAGASLSESSLLDLLALFGRWQHRRRYGFTYTANCHRRFKRFSNGRLFHGIRQRRVSFSKIINKKNISKSR